jgi:protein TonB
VESALRSAAVARIAPQDAAGHATEGREIIVAIGFPIPLAIDPPPPPPNPTVIAAPVWLQTPTAEDFARYYPAEALARGVAGRVTLACLVNANGRLSCVVLREAPTNRGFGDAALRVSRSFLIAPATSDGEPTVGCRVNVPLRFTPPH